MTTETIVEIPLGELHESPFNPRRTFNQAALEELATSIKAEGRIHEPLLVRPIVPPLFEGVEGASAGHEVVFGHRRLRAAVIAGLDTAPCMVRIMSDEEARRAQIAENLQRVDVHPIEEAQGFQALIKHHGYTADSIAEEQGKSRSYVYGRLKLLEACDAVHCACLAGEIGSEVALLFARHEPPLQAKALEKLKGSQFYRARNGYEDGGKAGFRAVRDFLNEYFMLKLKGALWALDDAELLPSAGACTTCPKRSGCSPEIFADVIDDKQRAPYSSQPGGEDVCTDPDCFADKKKAHLKREQAALEEKGKTVIAGAKARQIIGADGTVKGGYIEASKVRDLIKKAKADVAITTVQNPRDGKTRQVVKIEDLKAAGVKIAEPKADNEGRHRVHDAAAQKAREAKVGAQNAAYARLFMAVREAAAGRPLGIEELRLVTLHVAGAALEGDEGDFLCKLWGLIGAEGKPLSPWAARNPFAKRVEQADPAALTQFIMDSVLAVDVEVGYYSEGAKPEALYAAAKRLGIDPKTAMVASGESPSKKKRGKEKAPPESICRVCGCTENNACEGGCSWVEPDLCSACAEQTEEAAA